jgi:hypothetical protein
MLLVGATHRAAADAPDGRYQIAGGEVLDTQTKLVWQREASPKTMTWADAQATCTGPWRLPSVNELQTLVDETQLAPAIDTKAFPDFLAGSSHDCWTSSPVAGLSSPAWWYVEFDTGTNQYGNAEGLARVRCVR